MEQCFLHLAFIGPGGPEFLLVMLVLLIMFGAKDAPRILRKLNEIINQIRNTADGFKREVMYGDLSSDTPSYEDDYSDEDDYSGEGDYFDEDDDSAEVDDSAEDDISAVDDTASAEDDNVDAAPSSRYSSKQEHNEAESHEENSQDEPEPKPEDSLDEERNAGKD